MIKEFKEFLLRGNLLDLAVAVVIGAAFTGVVAAITATSSRRSSRPSSAAPPSSTAWTSRSTGRRSTTARCSRAAQLRHRGRRDLLPGDQAGQRADEQARPHAERGAGA